MHSPFRFTLIIAIIGLIIAGCASHNSQPIAPDETLSPQNLTGNADVPDISDINTHYLLSSGLIYVNTENPDDPIIEIIPAREGEIHLNILKFLEGAPCFDCFRIVGFNFSGPGYQYLNIDIRIDHPFTDLLYSVFDVRGIIMFDGNHEFPAIGKTTSDPSIGEGALTNADGYTALYNSSTLTAPVGDLQKYFPGKLSTATMPNSDINGYIYFRTDDPANDRNAFYANSFDIKTFSMKLPTDVFVIGYAVDASWAPPIETPVDDPLTDFDTTANCTEPWKIEVQDIGPGLTWEGGTTKLQIDVYDWQGKSTHHAPVVECPEIFNGICSAIWASDGDGYSRYEADISNTNLASGGYYSCLVSVEANENDPIGTPRLDLTGYEIFCISVHDESPFNLVDVTPPWLNFSPEGICLDGNYAYIAGGINGLHIFDISDPENPTWVNWVDTPGEARCVTVSGGYAYVTDYSDFYSTNNASLHIIDIDPPGSAYIVKSVDTPGAAYSVTVSGEYAFVADWGPGIQVIDIQPPESAHIVKTIDTPGQAWDIALSGGYAYVADSWRGVQIIDIDPLESAYIVKSVDTPDYAQGIAISAGYAYVTFSDNGPDGSLQIIDIDPPESAHFVKSIDTDGRARDVALSGGFAYVAVYYGGLKIINIESPESPYILSDGDYGFEQGIALSNGYAFVADSAFGLQVFDIDPPESIYIINTIATPGDAHNVAISNNYAYVGNFPGGLLLVVDLEFIESASIVDAIDLPDSPKCVALSGGYAYVADGDEGFQIVDIEPLESAHVVQVVETSSYTRSVALAGNYAYVADDYGLEIIDIASPESAYIVNAVQMPGETRCVKASGGYAYVANDASGLQIIDVEPPETAYIVNTVSTPEYARGVAVSDGYAYVADASYLNIIDIEPPESAYIVNAVFMPSVVQNVAVSGGYAYAAVSDCGLQIVDIEPPDSAYLVDAVDTPGFASDVVLSGDFAYIADHEGGLRIIKLW